MATVWMIITVLKCRRLHFLCMPYSHFKSTNLHITVCGEWILIERDWIGFTVTLLLVIYIKKQKTLQRHCAHIYFSILYHKGENTKLERQTQAELWICMQHCMRNFRELIYH